MEYQKEIFAEQILNISKKTYSNIHVHPETESEVLQKRVIPAEKSHWVTTCYFCKVKSGVAKIM